MGSEDNRGKFGGFVTNKILQLVEKKYPNLGSQSSSQMDPFNSYLNNATQLTQQLASAQQNFLNQQQMSSFPANGDFSSYFGSSTGYPSAPNYFPQHESQISNPPPTAHFGAPAPPPGAYFQPPVLQKADTLLSEEMLMHIPTRAVSARARFGATAVSEARKGLSRVLDASDITDIQLFGEQLKRTDRNAIEEDWRKEDRIPIFALSYVQHNPAVGRFKFDDEQWHCFLDIVREMAGSGVRHFRLWLDQCLWLRDASQGAWAHTGLLPYIMWPVVCLGKKRVGGEKSVESGERMWPFVEELAGLWGMGTIFGREMRGKDESAGVRRWMSYNIRDRQEPEVGMSLLLLNIFHGAVDTLKTGWVEDVQELKEMAKANAMIDGQVLFVGSDWKQRIARETPIQGHSVIQNMRLPIVDQLLGQHRSLYIDASRTVVGGGWNGIREWLSGNEHPPAGFYGNALFEMTVEKWNIITDQGEFQLLMSGMRTHAVWLLVAMEGPTSNFSRGKVAWTKVMTGVGSGQLRQAVENRNLQSVTQILSGELQRNVQIKSLLQRNEPIEWE